MSSVAVVNGQPRDPSSATPKENSQTPGPPPPVPPPNQTGATVSQSQSSQSQIGSSAPQPNSAPQRDSRRSEIYREPSPSGTGQALQRGLFHVLITNMAFILYPNALLRSYGTHTLQVKIWGVEFGKTRLKKSGSYCPLRNFPYDPPVFRTNLIYLGLCFEVISYLCFVFARYSGPKPLFAAAWANKNDRRFRLAVGSIVEREQGNNVTLIELDETLGSLVERGSFSHEFPANQIGFIPDLENKYPDLLATSADFLRLWRIHSNNLVTEEATLSSNKSSQFTAPLTNFDWNEVDPRLIGTSSIDTTCTIYDIEAQQAVGLIRPITFSVKTQLIAHDKPVHDIAFSRIFNGKDNFATVGECCASTWTIFAFSGGMIS
ncbi:hypothetical protein Y032_0190g1257 [Ancylostoma ceylanicum]|uniref:WD domain, G-beta repeat protein n=1 Tax=Ancylostoma ceylanicum TaxID=53326 RepID=A0A016SQW5_9BILA|nr:hypothetical protein Y032_0190g1257 [Ancylostoma ceylanicum]